jgi:hypothetical protein
MLSVELLYDDQSHVCTRDRSHVTQFVGQGDRGGRPRCVQARMRGSGLLLDLSLTVSGAVARQQTYLG